MTISYLYNGLGQRTKNRVQPIVPTGTNYYVYDEQGQLTGEYDNSLKVIQETVYLGNSEEPEVNEKISAICSK